MVFSVRSCRFAAVLLCLLLLVVTKAHASFSLTFQGNLQTLSPVLSAASITISSPSGIVVDPAGDVFIADTGNNQIVEVTPQGIASVLTISGLTPALSSPTGIAVDGSGNLYVADTGNSRVVEISPAGAGSVISTPSLTLSGPKGVALDQSGDILISDTGNNRIVEVTAGGTATALSITVSSGSASLAAPRGLSVDIGGNIFIADTGNNRVVKVTAGTTTGVKVSIGELDPALSSPSAVAIDRVGNVLIADTGNNRIVEVDTAGNGTTLLNTSLLQGTTLSGPLGIALDVFGTAYVADTGNSQALVVFPYLDADPSTGAGYTSSLNKSGVQFGHLTLGSSTAGLLLLNFSVGAPVSGLGGVKVFTSGTENLDFQIVAGENTTCSSSTGSGVFCNVLVSFLPTAPGLRNGALVLYDPDMKPVLTLPLYGWGDAPVAALSPNTGTVVSTGGVPLSAPFQAALDGAGNMYVANYSGSNVTKIAAGGGSATVLSLGTPGDTAVGEVGGVALDGVGNLFISDHFNNRIIVMTPGGVVSVLTINGLGSALNLPLALALDAAGNLYISDYGNGRVVEVSSLFVSGSSSVGIGSVISTGSYSTTSEGITGVAVDSMGNIYIPDGYAGGDPSRVIKVTAAGAVSLLTPTGITFSRPGGVGVDSMGNIYVADGGHNRIVEITTAGVASVVAINGLPSPTTLSVPFGVTLDPSGNLYIPDFGNSRVLFVNVSGARLSFPSTGMGATSVAQTATVTNLGNQPLVFSTNPTYTADFINNSSDTNPCTSSTSLSPGTICDVSVQFNPQSVGSLSAGITVTNNTFNVSGSTQQVSVSGTSYSVGDTTATTLTVSPTSLVRGQPATITAIVSDTTSGHASTHPTGSVTFSDTVGSTMTTLNNGSPVSLSGGVATLTGVLLSGIGSHTITVNYAGVSGTFLASNSSPMTATLSKASVTVTGPTTQPVAVINGQTGSATVTVTAPYTTISAPSGTLSYSIFNSSNASVASGTPTLTVGETSSTATISIPNSLAPGSYTISVTYSGDGNYFVPETATTIQVQISQLTPTLSWSPATTSITYGTTLSGILNATAHYGDTTIPGTLTYTATPMGGSAATVTSASTLSAGSYTLTATFTPSDTSTYKTVTTSVSFTVSRVTPSITWATPAAITYGTALGSTQLNASSTVAGTFAYTPASGTVETAGQQTLSVTFTPTDATDYTTATAQVTLTVNQAAPTISLTSSANPVLVTNGVTFTASVDATGANSSVAIETSRSVPVRRSGRNGRGVAEPPSKIAGPKIPGTPTGSVSFLDGTTLLGTVALSSGTASFTTTSLAAGSHAITAVASGDSDFTAVTSSQVVEVVQDYSLTVSSTPVGGVGANVTSQTVVPGGIATYELALGPTHGTTFPAPVTLSVSGLPPGATATLTPQVLPAGSALTNVTLSVQTANGTASLDQKQRPNRGIPGALWSGILLLPFAGRLRRAGKKLNRTLCLVLMLVAGIAATISLSGCGAGNGFFGQQQGTYNLTVTGTAGAVSHSTTVTLTVQ